MSEVRFIVEDESGLFELIGRSVAGDEPYAWSKWKSIRRFSLDDLERTKPEESVDERLQRVERTMLALTAEWLQLTGRAEPPMPAPVHEQVIRAAQVWRDAKCDRLSGCEYGDHDYACSMLVEERALCAAIDAFRAGRMHSVALSAADVEELRGATLGNQDGSQIERTQAVIERLLARRTAP